MIGIDIVEIQRIEKLISDPKFLQRVYTDYEINYIQSKQNSKHNTAAGIFCAKEAVAKALGTGISEGIEFKSIEIKHTSKGSPTVVLYGKAKEMLNELNGTMYVSITHDKNTAAAAAFLKIN